MKVGKAGSIPDGVAQSQNPASLALHALKKEIGKAVFNLNTMVVGLDAVETGYKKPASLDISWSPVDRVVAARQSRRFLVEAVLVRVSESLKEYFNALSKLPKFQGFQVGWEASKTSAADRIKQISVDVVGDSDYLVPAAMLVIHWRNRIVHSATSEAKLRHQEKVLLQTNEALILERYRGLEVDRLLSHFSENHPTLKDVSSLIAMCINLANKIDKTVYNCTQKDDVLAWLDHYKILPLIEKVRRETKVDKVKQSLEHLLSSKAPQLKNAYFQYCYNENTSNQLELRNVETNL